MLRLQKVEWWLQKKKWNVESAPFFVNSPSLKNCWYYQLDVGMLNGQLQ